MDSAVSNLLYRHPELYESVYDGDDHAVPRMCERLFQRHLGGAPSSILDIGCGTGRDLEYLAKRCPDSVGVDYQPAMVAYARQQRPAIDFRCGDMRTFRLGRAFQAVLSFGYALANVHAIADLDAAVATFAAHCAPGGLLLLEVINPVAQDALPRRFTLDTPSLKAQAHAEYRLHPAEQLLERLRTWTVVSGTATSGTASGGEPVHDRVRFRLLYPKELEYYLSNHGFRVLETFDNTGLVPREPAGPSLFVAARFVR